MLCLQMSTVNIARQRGCGEEQTLVKLGCWSSLDGDIAREQDRGQDGDRLEGNHGVQHYRAVA